jgi:peptidoglycan/xylan/chitin deacetylase (PgdA/CDA1 family)
VNGVPILMYHRVPRDDSLRSPMAVPLADFDAQMNYLRRRGIEVMPLETFLTLHRARKRPGRPSVVLTFDDGYGSTCDNVEDVLERYDLPATLFVTTGFVGQQDPLDSAGEGVLTWHRIRALRRLDVQAHTISHPRLSQLGAALVRRELQESKESLEHELGRPVKHFAYPFGGYSGPVVQQVRQAGYASACSVHRGPATLDDDRFCLHRVAVEGGDSLETFASLVQTGFRTRYECVASTVRDDLYSLPYLHDLSERPLARRLVDLAGRAIRFAR